MYTFSACIGWCSLATIFSKRTLGKGGGGGGGVWGKTSRYFCWYYHPIFGRFVFSFVDSTALPLVKHYVWYPCYNFVFSKIFPFLRTRLHAVVPDVWICHWSLAAEGYRTYDGLRALQVTSLSFKLLIIYSDFFFFFVKTTYHILRQHWYDHDSTHVYKRTEKYKRRMLIKRSSFSCNSNKKMSSSI